MQFNLSNYSAPALFEKKLESFRGVDYSNATLSIAPNRSPSAINWVYRDGLNQKRNGYKQFAYHSGKINGYWEFRDSSLNVHRIMHCGTSFYEVTPSSSILVGATYNELTITYRPSYYSQNEWNEYISQVKNEKSFGIVRGDRLYIFAGIMLVYGKWNNTWELRAVRDNIDTYIPVVTTNIDYDGYDGELTRSLLEDVNMMSCRRKARLILPSEEISSINVSEERDSTIIENQAMWDNYTGTIIPIKYSSSNRYSKVIVRIYESNYEYISHTYSVTFGDTNNSIYTFDSDASIGTDVLNQNPLFFNKYTIHRIPNYNAGLLTYSYEIALGYLENDVYKIEVVLEDASYNYTIDTNGINSTIAPTIKNIATGETIDSSTYDVDYVNGKILFRSLDNFAVTHTPDIEVEYSPRTLSTDYQKIDGCKFGCMFGYNAIEHLFASGNENYPNVDWHTNEAFFDYNSDIPSTQNLTYWSDLSYEYMGGQQSAIKGYVVLSDNTLGILKEEVPNETTLYIRSPYFASAVTADGNVVRDSSGNTFEKLYYSTVASAIGLGCISTFSCANLDGDRLFLSPSGVYGIEIAEAVASPFNIQRFARRRSFYINPKLTAYDLETLSKASGIVFESRYYLALNDSEGTVFIADKTDNLDVDYSRIYEWYCWKGIKANGWFVDINGNLGFTTDDGRVCKFNDKELFYDREVDVLNSLSIKDATEDSIFTTFTTGLNDLDKIESSGVIHVMNDDLHEIILPFGNATYDYDLGVYTTTFNNYYDYLIYYDTSDVYIWKGRAFSLVPVRLELHEEHMGFKLYDANDEEVVLDDEFCLLAPLNEENAIIDQEIEENEYTFKIQARNGQTNALLHFDTQTIADLHLLDSVAIINEKNVVAKWYSPIMNMGDSNYSKTLKYFTIIPERYLQGEVTMTFITRVKETNVNIEGLDYLESLDNIDLNTISLDPTLFAKSFSKKYKIRNFNFLQVVFESSNKKNAALHNMSLTYVVSKRNRGVK